MNDPWDFAEWYDDWVADPLNDCPDRSDREDMQEAFEAGYLLAYGRCEGR